MRATFLILEDDIHVGKVLTRTLSRFGVAELVPSCRAGRAALAKKPFHAIVADVGLPDGSGLELIAAARALDPSLPALVVSGRVDAVLLREAHTLSAHYLLKPVEDGQLELFAARVRARVETFNARTKATLATWTGEYALTPTEGRVLELAVAGVSRAQLAQSRDVAPSTIKKQVQTILDKTGDPTLEAAVSRLLRAALVGTS